MPDLAPLRCCNVDSVESPRPSCAELLPSFASVLWLLRAFLNVLPASRCAASGVDATYRFLPCRGKLIFLAGSGLIGWREPPKRDYLLAMNCLVRASLLPQAF